jgi:hypothetical protein
MCDDNDLEGVRLWFYGGTPPSGDMGQEDPETHASVGCPWARGWAAARRGEPAADAAPELAAA